MTSALSYICIKISSANLIIYMGFINVKSLNGEDLLWQNNTKTKNQTKECKAFFIYTLKFVITCRVVYKYKKWR